MADIRTRVVSSLLFSIPALKIGPSLAKCLFSTPKVKRKIVVTFEFELRRRVSFLGRILKMDKNPASPEEQAVQSSDTVNEQPVFNEQTHYVPRRTIITVRSLLPFPFGFSFFFFSLKMYLVCELPVMQSVMLTMWES